MNIYDQHNFYVEQLTKYKKLELESRNEILKTIKNKVVEGKVKNEVKVGQDMYQLEALFKLSKKIDESELDTLWPSLTEEEKGCIQKKPGLKGKEYKAYLKNIKELEESGEINISTKLLDCIIEKPSQATLSIIKVENAYE